MTKEELIAVMQELKTQYLNLSIDQILKILEIQAMTELTKQLGTLKR